MDHGFFTDRHKVVELFGVTKTIKMPISIRWVIESSVLAIVTMDLGFDSFVKNRGTLEHNTKVDCQKEEHPHENPRDPKKCHNPKKYGLIERLWRDSDWQPFRKALFLGGRRHWAGTLRFPWHHLFDLKLCPTKGASRRCDICAACQSCQASVSWRKGFSDCPRKNGKWFYILKIWTPRKSISHYTYIGFGFKPLDLYIIYIYNYYDYFEIYPNYMSFLYRHLEISMLYWLSTALSWMIYLLWVRLEKHQDLIYPTSIAQDLVCLPTLQMEKHCPRQCKWEPFSRHSRKLVHRYFDASKFESIW